jgi:selenocysteine-specific elongation factor
MNGMSAADFVRRGGLDPAAAEETMLRLTSAGAFVARDRIFDGSIVSRIQATVSAELEGFHRAFPLETGMPREALRDAVAHGAPASLFEGIVDTLLRQGTIAGSDRLGLPGRGASLDAETARAKDAVERMIRDGGLEPPEPSAVVSAAGIASAAADAIVQRLIRERRIVRLGPLLFHAAALERLKTDLAALKAQTPAIDVGTFKQRYGLSRKFAIPLLEWLDRERVTRRVGEQRVIV